MRQNATRRTIATDRFCGELVPTCPLDRLSSFACFEQPTPSAARLYSLSPDPNIGQNDKERRQPFYSPILPLIFGTAKPLIGQGRETVSKLLIDDTP